MRLNVGLPGERAPHARGSFKTPSGKCEFRPVRRRAAISWCPFAMVPVVLVVGGGGVLSLLPQPCRRSSA
jgi:hypothetical protein